MLGNVSSLRTKELVAASTLIQSRSKGKALDAAADGHLIVGSKRHIVLLPLLRKTHLAIPPFCEWIWKVDRNWIYPYPGPVVITDGVD